MIGAIVEERIKWRENMRKMFKRVTAVSMMAIMFMSQPVQAASIPYVGTEQEVQAAYAETSKKGQEMLKALCSTYQEESAQYALIDNGKIVLTGRNGSYSRTENTALTDGHMYGIGSISKMYVTAAIMKLQEEGKIDLDAPVTQYVPEFKMADERYKKITVRMLLNHSSGLLGSTFKGALTFGTYNEKVLDEFLESLKTQRLKADPGAFSVYCNDGFTLAEIVVERVSGKDFTTFLREKFILDLGMNRTRTPAQSFYTNRLAKTYISGVKDALPKEVFGHIGAGGIYSSAADICRFATIFMDGDTHLSDKTREAMEAAEYEKGIWPEGENTTLSYGLGWDSVNMYPFNQYGIKALTKGGDTITYHASLIVLPEEKMAVAVLSSGGASTYNQVAAQEILLTALKEKGVINEIKPPLQPKAPVSAQMPASMKDYSGYYGGQALYKVTIRDDGTLKLGYPEMTGMPDTVLNYTADGDFATVDGSARIKFIKESNGRIYMQQDALSNMPFLGQTASYQYASEKLEENPVSDEVWKVWKKRNGQLYFLVDEPFNSVYYISGVVARINLLDELKGYLSIDAIQDNNLAMALIQIPGVGGRDLNDIRFYKKGNTEYVQVGNNHYVNQSAVKSLPTLSGSKVKIGSDGESKWYTVNKAAGMTMTVTVPKNASFTVYDKTGNVVLYSQIANKKTVKLSKGDLITFVGAKNSTFTLNYK